MKVLPTRAIINCIRRRRRLGYQRKRGPDVLEGDDARRLRTLWVSFAGPSSPFSRRFQRSSAPLRSAKFMRVRLVRLAAIILRKKKTIIAIISEPVQNPRPRAGTGWLPPGNEGRPTHLKNVALAADDEPSRWLLVPLLGATHVALAPRSHWYYSCSRSRSRETTRSLMRPL
jgi:hypothetical protein